jgi:hypothetical protein
MADDASEHAASLKWDALIAQATEYADHLGILNKDGEFDQAKIDEIQRSWLEKS